jgi:CheY-like chemotaxis protein
MLKMLLKKVDITASIAGNGQEAVDMVSNDVNKYHMVFMDNLMPVMVRSSSCYC